MKNTAEKIECMGPVKFGNDYQGMSLRDDFRGPSYSHDCVQSIDAPAYIPTGSHRTGKIHRTPKPWVFTNGFHGSTREFMNR
jgi:hypothetical protein